jgi:tryptophan synthase alpha subunit
VIVGSAIINVIEQNLENPKLVELVGKFVHSLTPGLVRS